MINEVIPMTTYIDQRQEHSKFIRPFICNKSFDISDRGMARPISTVILRTSGLWLNCVGEIDELVERIGSTLENNEELL